MIHTWNKLDELSFRTLTHCLKFPRISRLDRLVVIANCFVPHSLEIYVAMNLVLNGCNSGDDPHRPYITRIRTVHSLVTTGSIRQRRQ